MRRRTTLRRALVGVVLGSAVVSGCSLVGTRPDPTPSATGDRPFTVMSTDRIRVADPAAITDAGSAMLSENVFQRLMTAEPGADVLKPDAARDCLFTAATVYTCTLNEKLMFHNGHVLSSSDVKFSIDRATRLAVPGSSASLLSSLRKIETPDDRTIRFVLSRVDTQFGWALASPAASIVDEETYDADEVRPPTDPIVASGPFSVRQFDDSSLVLDRNLTYVGRTPAQIDALTYRTAPDSAAIEAAMKAGTVDVVWRGLSDAANTRYGQQVSASPEGRTGDGYAMRTLGGLRVHQLIWNPESSSRSNTGLRKAIVAALQEDRTSDSIVPNGVPGHATSFVTGGEAKPKVTWSNRIQLTLGYDSTAPDARDRANELRTRLEDTGGLSVRVRPDDAGADLQLVDRKAWTATALAWLQPYVDAPLTGSAQETVETLETQYRASTTDADSARLLAGLQSQAATDGLVLPLDQGDEILYTRGSVEVKDATFGPGWQLGFFNMKAGG